MTGNNGRIDLACEVADIFVDGARNEASGLDIARAVLDHLFPVLTTPEELDELPIESVIACISHVANVPVCIVFQRGSQENLGNGWTTPDALGQITSEQVFQLVGLNGFPPAMTVLHRP